jgi:hypothetical protein
MAVVGCVGLGQNCTTSLGGTQCRRGSLEITVEISRFYSRNIRDIRRGPGASVVWYLR